MKNNFFVNDQMSSLIELLNEKLCIQNRNLLPSLQGTNARKVNFGCLCWVPIKTSSLWAEFVNKNRCISVRSSIRGG